jgi:hypothetical protein
MAINTSIAIPNVTKTKTYGLNDVIREDGYGYATLYTVLNSETLRIKQGMFAIDYLTVDACYISVYLTINSIRFTLFQDYITATTRGNTKVAMTDLNIENLNLKTGDTIKIEFVYTTGIASPPSGDIKAGLLIEDFTA